MREVIATLHVTYRTVTPVERVPRCDRLVMASLAHVLYCTLSERWIISGYSKFMGKPVVPADSAVLIDVTV